MSFSDVLEALKAFGFPVVVCLILLYRFDKYHHENAKLIADLTTEFRLLRLALEMSIYLGPGRRKNPSEDRTGVHGGDDPPHAKLGG